MIEQLFGSKTRVKLLHLFFSNPNRPFYVREITRKIDEQINSVRRELANLLSIGIISSDNNNNRLYYEVNQKFEYYKPLLEMFGGSASPQKAVLNEVDEELNILKSLGNIDLVIYTGQFTRDDSAGVDILVVGDVNHTKMTNFITALEKKEGRDINYTVMTPAEFNYRRKVNDRFLANVMSSKKQILIDKNYTLAQKPEKPKKSK